MRYFIILSLLLFSMPCLSEKIKYFSPGAEITYDSIPYMVDNPAFNASYDELLKMFRGETPYNLKRAEFLIENAYFDGKLSYKTFSHNIDSVVRVLNTFIDINHIRKYKTAPNFAIFDYFTQPSIMNGYRKMSYDFDDPMGLGGGNAAAASMATGRKAITFNPAYVSYFTKKINGLNSDNANVVNYISSTPAIFGLHFTRDLITNIQNSIHIHAIGQNIPVAVGFYPTHGIETIVKSFNK